MIKKYLKEKIVLYKKLMPLFFGGLFVFGCGLIYCYLYIEDAFQRLLFTGSLLFTISLFFIVTILFYELRRFFKKLKDYNIIKNSGKKL